VLKLGGGAQQLAIDHHFITHQLVETPQARQFLEAGLVQWKLREFLEHLAHGIGLVGLLDGPGFEAIRPPKPPITHRQPLDQHTFERPLRLAVVQH